jgi:hypothetical protein
MAKRLASGLGTAVIASSRASEEMTGCERIPLWSAWRTFLASSRDEGGFLVW